MRVIGAEHPWPTEWKLDSKLGVRMPRKMPVTTLIERGVCEWVRKTGKEPTHVLLGPRERRILREQPDFYYFETIIPPNEKDKLMGLTLIYTRWDGIELLGDIE